VSTFLTAAVIGITLALPAALHVLAQNVSAISYSWEGTLQASLFLKDSVTPERGRELAKSVDGRTGVARASYISREQSLVEFRELSGFGEALDLLTDNPLPAVIVVITVGNTIRLDIENRRDEIIVMKLIGAPDGFIRRPFLYTGVWYGAFGGLIAWTLVDVALGALAGPARHLAGLYESSFQLAGLSWQAGLVLVGAGVALGGLGSVWTVGRHLSRYEPG
jgi:cell division protein FtsX